MPRPFKHRPELGLDRMFETRSDAWEAVGLALETSERSVKRAQKQVLALIPAIIAVLVAYDERHHWLRETHVKLWQGSRGVIYSSPGKDRTFLRYGSGYNLSGWETPVQVAAVILFIVLGWALARAVGKAAGPTLMKRMDPGTAGTVGFLIRLATVLITVIVALDLAGVNTQSLAIGASFTAVIFGLAAQQTLGNLIAGMVLLSARPFRVGELIRLQAGAVGGSVEGIVSSLGLLYTTLARGEDRVLIPNNVVLAAAVVPLREPDAVDVKVRLGKTVRPGQLQEILDDRIETPTRNGTASVLLEEIDGEDVIVRVRATPERAVDGAKLADEIIGVLTSVTGEHTAVMERTDGTEPGGSATRPQDSESTRDLGGNGSSGPGGDGSGNGRGGQNGAGDGRGSEDSTHPWVGSSRRG